MLLIANQQNVFEKLDRVNFNFEGATTQYFTHKFHPYPARFIPQIPKPFIELFTKEGDTVFDPMCGSGTTCKMAIKNNRSYIGCDISKEYVELTKKRLREMNHSIQ